MTTILSADHLSYRVGHATILADLSLAIEEGRRTAASETWTRVIWDVTAVAWLLDGDFMADTLVHSPIPQYDHTWTPSSTRHFIRYVYAIHRDRLLADLVHKLAK